MRLKNVLKELLIYLSRVRVPEGALKVLVLRNCRGAGAFFRAAYEEEPYQFFLARNDGSRYTFLCTSLRKGSKGFV